MKALFKFATLPLFLAALPAQAEVAWQGEFVIATATAACDPYWKQGDFTRAVYRPANDGDTITTNDVDSYLSIVALRSAFAHKIVGGQIVQGGTGDPLAGVAINSRGKSFNFNGTYRSIVMLPTTLTATTPTVRMSGTIVKFTNIVGCTVNFRANFVLRPDL